MLALLLLLAAKGAAAQGPGNGISKSTWAASDPIHTSYPWLCADCSVFLAHCSAPPF